MRGQGRGAAGREEEALRWLEQALPALRRTPAWAMNYLRTLCDAVETVWLLGGHPCRDLLEDAVRTKALAADFRFPMMDARLALARLCSLDGRHAEARQSFAAARTVLEAEQARPLRAIVDFDEAVMSLRIGALGDARGLRQAALGQFEALGMVGWAARAGQIRVRAQDRVHRR
jgi:hypothetical protein